MGKGYVREHCVPTKILMGLITDTLRRGHDRKEIEAKITRLISDYCRVAYITEAEDKKLRGKKPYKGRHQNLYQKMPANWCAHQNDPFDARYREVGIELTNDLPFNFKPDRSGRPAEMDYARQNWTPEQATAEILLLRDAGLALPLTPIRAILVGFAHTQVSLSLACLEEHF